MKPLSFALTFLCTLLVLGGCRTHQASLTEHPVRRYLPEEVRDLYFGLPLETFLAQKRDLSRAEGEGDFRTVLIEEPMPGKLESVVYYFDADGDEPLYEIIAIYPDKPTRDAVADELLGAPNFDNKEWRYDSGEGYQIWAWTFQNKLVIAAILPNTEWADEE